MDHAARSRIAALLLFILPAAAFAQQVKGVRCTAHPSWQPSCSSDSECDDLWRAHRCSAHDECGSSVASSMATAAFSLRGSPTRVVVKSAIAGGFVGAIAGSFKLNADSGAMAGPGAALGMGAFLAMGIVRNRGTWSRLGATVAGATAGAALGAGSGLMADGKLEKDSPEDLDTEDKAIPQAKVGALVGAVVGFAINELSLSKFSALPGTPGGDRRIRLLNTGRRLGLSIAW